jgi:ankyrin repeat protein
MSQQFLKNIQRGATAEIADMVAADPDLLSWRDAQGVTALLWSIYSGQKLVRDYFLAQMAQAGIALDIFEAAAVGGVAALRQALNAAPDSVGAWSGDGWTALHLAAAFGTPEAVQLLLDSGASVHAVAKNPQANQPLHAALALGRNPETIRLLLEAGADANARQTGGFTAIFSAAAANRRDLAEILVAHGANPGILNDFGQSAAGFARERGHTELAGWLEGLNLQRP